jgi:hypothetical protein
MTCPLGAVHAASCNGNKMRIALVERGIFEEEQNIRLNPELQTPHRQKNALRFASAKCSVTRRFVSNRWMRTCTGSSSAIPSWANSTAPR